MGSLLVSIHPSRANPCPNVCPQLHLLWWSLYPSQQSYPRTHGIIQHPMGRHQKGSRTIELLPRSSQDSITVPGRPHLLLHRGRWYDRTHAAIRPLRMEYPSHRLECNRTFGHRGRLAYSLPHRPQPLPHGFLVLSLPSSSLSQFLITWGITMSFLFFIFFLTIFALSCYPTNAAPTSCYFRSTLPLSLQKLLSISADVQCHCVIGLIPASSIPFILSY